MIKLLLIIVIFVLTNAYSFHIGYLNGLKKVTDCILQVVRKLDEMEDKVSPAFLEGIEFVCDHLIDMIKRGIR